MTRPPSPGRPVASFLAACLVASLSACALLTKSDPTLIRYYSLDAPPRGEASAAAPPKRTPPLQLRLGRVNAASYIRDRIAFRSSGVEVGYFDELMWTDKPESYVRRALARALFDDQGLEEIVGGIGPTLDVDVDAFEELRDKRSAVVELSWQLRDDTVVLLRRTVTVEHALAGDPKEDLGAATAVAMSSALRDAIDPIVRDVVASLAASAVAAAPHPPPSGGSGGRVR